MSYTKGQILTYNYTGTIQTLNMKGIRKVKIECWGAGGYGPGSGKILSGQTWYPMAPIQGTTCDYCSGELNVIDTDVLYLYVGGLNCWNGGAKGTDWTSSDGRYKYEGCNNGDRTDIRLDGTDSENIIISASGGIGGGNQVVTKQPNIISGVSNGTIVSSGGSPANQVGKIVITIEKLNNNKFLIKQDNKYYSVKDNILTELGTPTDDTEKQQWFNDYGVDDLKEALLTPDEEGNKLIDALDNQFEARTMVPKD